MFRNRLQTFSVKLFQSHRSILPSSNVQYSPLDSSILSNSTTFGSFRGYRTFQPGDIVLARHVLRPDRPFLSNPLEEGKDWNLGTSIISHKDVIGLPVRTTVVSERGQRGQKFILTYPSLEEYTIHRRRQAQPIYPLDAAAIVALADIHEDESGALGYGRVTGTQQDAEASQDSQTSESENQALPLAAKVPMRQYFEAGTGHGSLTLAIARAIHAANGKYRATGDKSERGAVLHSVDRNSTHSRTGRHNVRDFRRGMYLGDVEFHIYDSPELWLKDHGDFWASKSQLESADGTEIQNQRNTDSDDTFESPGAFLSAAFLDLPAPDASIDALASRLLVDSPLIVFCPSVSQIQDMAEHVRLHESVDLSLVNTVELMPGIAGGSMRAWDVRSTVVRQTGEVAKVCRPRVGLGVAGGGFVAIFRKLPHGARIKLREAKDKELEAGTEKEKEKEREYDNKENSSKEVKD